MDKSMTGDGAVVRDALTPEQTAHWMEAIASCMTQTGDAIPVAALQAGARHIRQQAAEIERLTRERDEAIIAAKDGFKRLFASEARTADLLKALEEARDWIGHQPGSLEGVEAIRRIRAAIAAAKGATV